MKIGILLSAVLLIPIFMYSCGSEKKESSNTTMRNSRGNKFDPSVYKAKIVTDEFIRNPFSFSIIDKVDGDFEKIGKVVLKSNENESSLKGEYPYSVFVQYDGLSIYIGTYDIQKNGRPIYSIRKDNFALSNGLKVGDSLKQIYELFGKPDIANAENLYYESKDFYSLRFFIKNDNIYEIKWQKEP